MKRTMKKLAVVFVAIVATFSLNACDMNDDMDGGSPTDAPGTEKHATIETQHITGTTEHNSEGYESGNSEKHESEDSEGHETGDNGRHESKRSGGAGNNSSSDIGYDKVIEIVLARVPGAVKSDIYEMEREYDDGRLEYEGSIYYNGYEYEFEIDGATGNILQWEIEAEDDD